MEQVEMLWELEIDDIPENIITRWTITKNQIDQLLQGRCITITDGEYLDIISMDEDDRKNCKFVKLEDGRDGNEKSRNF